MNRYSLTAGLLALHSRGIGGGFWLPFVCEAEGNNWKTSIVVCTRFSVLELLLALLILQVALLSVDVTHATVPTGMLQCPAQQARVGKCVLHDTAVSVEAQMYQVVCPY
jgi:hypothetical protein